MTEFRRYRLKGIVELRPWRPGDDMMDVFITELTRSQGHPKKGDMIARRLGKQEAMWLITGEDVNRFYERTY
jgi:hypothetical protein